MERPAPCANWSKRGTVEGGEGIDSWMETIHIRFMLTSTRTTPHHTVVQGTSKMSTVSYSWNENYMGFYSAYL
jgi:hypothetical protein